MPLPTQREIEAVLLQAIADVGGSARPRQIYDTVAEQFPDMTPDERGEELDSGHNKFNNRVQWARQRLVSLGLLDSSQRGIWTITSEGREALSSGDIQAST